MKEQTGRRSLSAMCLMILLAPVAVFAADPALPPDEVDQAVGRLELPHDSQSRVQVIVDHYHQQQMRLRESLLAQMEKTLTAQQFEKFKSSLRNSSTNDDTGSTATADGATRMPVTITGGHDTDPRDGGRPVILIAAALDVPADVFRKVFSGVHPAGPGQQPQESQVRENKRILLDGLGPYGVTDDRLNEVSNYYRYSRSRGQMWRNKPAKVDAIVRDGKLTGFLIADPGAGYSTPPAICVSGFPEAKATVKLKFGTDLDSNGSIESVTLSN